MAVVEIIAIIGTISPLGNRIATSLVIAGYNVTAIQRKDLQKPLLAGLQVVKTHLSDEADLTQAFKGQGVPTFENEKIWIDAAIAASVKCIILSELTTNLESPLAIQLPVATEKVKVRQYLTSNIGSPSAPTTWTSLNNNAFIDMTIRFGALGHNSMTKQAVFHNGGDDEIRHSTLADIADAIVRILDPGNFADTANRAVYIYFAAVTERKLTAMVSKTLGVDFGSVENGRIPDVNVGELMKKAKGQLEAGNMTGMFNY